MKQIISDTAQDVNGEQTDSQRGKWRQVYEEHQIPSIHVFPTKPRPDDGGNGVDHSADRPSPPTTATNKLSRAHQCRSCLAHARQASGSVAS